MTAWVPLAAALGYTLILFAVAWRVENRAAAPARRVSTYALSLAVYCTSWTFFGAVGTAAGAGWNYLPIYLGPALLFLLAPRFLQRLILVARREGATSIADFISSRHGKNPALAALVTAFALFSALPYIALQLKSVGMSYAELVASGPMSAARGGGGGGGGSENDGVVLAVAIALAFFAILFGARRYDVGGRNRGLVVAVAVESAVKLAALCIVGGFAIVLFDAASPGVQAQGIARFSAQFDTARLSPDFITITLLSMAAIVCLPRQFYVGVVEAPDADIVRRARWPFIGYMAVTSLVVLPITLGGLTLLGPSATPDLYVLDLPLAGGNSALALLVFLGGFSAATAMVVVETLALSTMVSNDLIAPLLLRSRMALAEAETGREADMGGLLLIARRLTIVAIVGAAYGYYLAVEQGETLAAIGLVAFAAVAQFAPSLVGAVLWNGSDPRSARAGLIAGMALWFYTLVLPSALGGPLQWGALDPRALFGMRGLSPLTHGVLWSLGVNLLLYAGGQLRTRRLPLPFQAADPAERARFGAVTSVEDLRDLTARFIGPEAAREAFADYAAAPPSGPSEPAEIDAGAARLAERLVASVIGAPSARAIIASGLSGSSLGIADVVRLLDDTSQSMLFSKGLLAATLENIDSGVSVVDKDLRLLAWNGRYAGMFDYPAAMMRVGAPIADLIRYNALRGECGPGEVDAHVERRLAHMRRREPHVFERARPDGTVLKTVGGPMPGDGYIMSFIDVTAERGAQDALAAANAGLESRVAERTAELIAANAELEHAAVAIETARRQAEAATRDKTQFLAAASHDLLQPLHAARLFCAALSDDLTDGQRPLAANIDQSLAAADRLLRSLLDISQLDAGGVRPVVERFDVGALIAELVDGFRPSAQAKRLRLRFVRPSIAVETDATLLRSILQNFIANAIRYTEAGGVVVGARKRGGRIRIEVRDSGVGIPTAEHARIFQAFRKGTGVGSGRAGVRREADATNRVEGPGVGLGLAIVERTARLLGADIDMRSTPGRGSLFAVTVPIAAARADAENPVPTGARTPSHGRPAIDAHHVLCVDDDPYVLEGLVALLGGWGCDVTCAASFGDAEAMIGKSVDAAFIDYQLGAASGDRRTGLDLIAAVRARWPDAIVALVTADPSAAVARAAAELGAAVLRKPVDPLRLRALLAYPAIAAADVPVRPVKRE